MTNLKCIRCGALSVGNEICKLCEIELNPIRPSASPAIFPAYQPRYVSDDPDTIILPFNSVGDLVGPTISLFTKHFWLITKLCVVIVAPFQIFKALSFGDIESDWQLAAGIYVLELMCSVLIAPALTYALMQAMQTGSAPGINESYRWGLSKLGKLLLCSVMVWVLVMLGFVLLIIPGIILFLAFELVYPIAVLEGGSATEILQRSYNLTKGHRWNILGATFVMSVMLSVASAPASILVTWLAFSGVNFWPLQVLALIISDILSQGATILSLVIYIGILRTLESRQSLIE